MNFIAINEATGTNNLLEIETTNKNKKQRSYQVIKTSGFGFISHEQSKRRRNKVSEDSRFEFYSHKPSKRERNKCLIKAQILAVLVLKSEMK